MRVLDYGCGEALHADLVAAVAGEVLLCEAAARVRAKIAVCFADNPKIRAVAGGRRAPTGAFARPRRAALGRAISRAGRNLEAVGAVSPAPEIQWAVGGE